MEQKRIYWIDIARAISICAIVLGHVIVNCTELYSVYKFLLSFNVIIFFILSGYTFSIKRKYGSFILNKFLRLIVPYFIFALLFLIPFFLMGKIAGDTLEQNVNFDFLTSIKDILYGTGKGDCLKQNSPLWFLPALFTIEILYYPIIKLDLKVNKIWFSFSMLFILIVIGYFSTYLNFVLPFGVNSFLNIGFFLYVGFLIKKYFSSFFDRQKLKNLLLIFTICILLSIPCIIFNKTVDCRNYSYGNYLLFLLESIFMCSSIIVLSMIIKKCKFLEYIGKHTIEILVFHKIIILVFQTLMGEFSNLYLKGNIFIQLFLSITVFIYTIIFSLIFSEVTNRFTPFVYGKKYNISKSKKNRNLSDIIKVTLSNVTTVLSSILVGFLLPKILGLSDYGMFKTFTLYITYTGLLSFGLIEGVYLKFGGVQYDDLDFPKMRFYTKTILIIQALLSFALCLIAFFALNGDYKLIFVYVSIYIFCGNVNSYYAYISQSTKKFNVLSIRNVIRSALISLVVISLFIINKVFDDYTILYHHYTIVFLIIYLMLDLWYIITYRKITFGKCISDFSGLKSLFLLGFPLLLSHMIGTLMLTVDRQFVNVLFDKETYAIYAFAYNLLSIVTTATSAISTVIYPNLVNAQPEDYTKKYKIYKKIVSVLVSGALCLYFPLCVVINGFLPQYKDSILIFRIIFPGLILSACTQVVMDNFYKVLNKNTQFFYINLIGIIISIGLDFAAYYIFGTTESISAVSIISLLIWYLISELTLSKKFKIKEVDTLAYILIIGSEFYLISCIDNYYLAFVVFVTLYAITTILFNYKFFIRALKKNELKHYLGKEENTKC